ncbi:MAG: hypothetical protein ABSA53_23760 [Streptosporangiaceae bacterium]|jgi:hypothetical protein
MYEDEDNDGKFPDETPVEVRYPRSKQEEQADRGIWPWLPPAPRRETRCDHLLIS